MNMRSSAPHVRRHRSAMHLDAPVECEHRTTGSGSNTPRDSLATIHDDDTEWPPLPLPSRRRSPRLAHSLSTHPAVHTHPHTHSSACQHSSAPQSQTSESSEGVSEEDDEEMEEDQDENSQSGSEEEEEGDDEMQVDEEEEEEEEEIKEAPSTGQSELRKQIIKIQTDTTIAAPEKAKRIQELMTKGWATKQQKDRSKDVKHINRLSNKRDDFNIVTEDDKAKTSHSNEVLGCKHYQRACKLQAHCCGKWDTCRFCHDEVSDHTITRFLTSNGRNLITTMMCMYCSTVQEAGQDCINEACGKRVARYYCKECKLWDDDPRKNIYHCYDCGICRIGKGLGIDYFHCQVCNVCMAIGLKGRHKCIERNLESDCPICGEYMFTSTSTVIFMPCGHCMHHKCHQQFIQTSYQCPTCLKSLADMTDYFRRIDTALAQHKMPPEYHDTFSHVYCNDCEKKSHAKFHFIYHKCGHCKGYNTKILSTLTGLPADAVIAPEPTAVIALPITDTLSSTGSSSRSPIQSARSSTSSRREADAFQQYLATRSDSPSAMNDKFWCHQCQLPTEVFVRHEDDVNHCVTCSSDFVEEL